MGGSVSTATDHATALRAINKINSGFFIDLSYAGSQPQGNTVILCSSGVIRHVGTSLSALQTAAVLFSAACVSNRI
jgi:hypothetical protein